MKTYQIFANIKTAATYDERDGFGDYANFATRRVCQVGANSEIEALKIANVKNNIDMTFWAEEITNA